MRCCRRSAGQTGLNLAVALDDAGVLERYDVRVLGTPLAAVRAAEDRGGFRDLVTGHRRAGAGERGRRVGGRTGCVRAAAEGAGRDPAGLHARRRGRRLCAHAGEARERIAHGLAASPIGQVLVERSLLGWYEIEFEVLRDAVDTTIAICGMENLDPMGVHTGD